MNELAVILGGGLVWILMMGFIGALIGDGLADLIDGPCAIDGCESERAPYPVEAPDGEQRQVCGSCRDELTALWGWR